MSKAKFAALRKKAKSLAGIDYLDKVAYHDGRFEANLNVIATEDGDPWTVKTPNGIEKVRGFSFVALALEHDFAMTAAGVFEYCGSRKAKPKAKKQKSEADKLVEADLPEPDSVKTVKK